MRTIELDHALLAEHLDARRRMGLAPIVLATGNFDILHVGHCRLLKAAKAYGSTLVLGLNSDASIMRNRGPGRPIVPERERLEMLSHFREVDFLTLFDEETPGELIERLRPDVFAKGTDYNGLPLPEDMALRRVGAKVIFVGDLKTHSSSALLRRLQEIVPTPRYVGE